MPKICIVTTQQIEEIKLLNYFFLSKALLERNADVWIGLMDSVTSCSGHVYGKCVKINSPLVEGEKFPTLDNNYFVSLEQFDYIWILSLIKRNILLDKLEIIKAIKKPKIINSIESLIYLSSKINSIQFDGVQYPETYISSDFDFLWKIISESDSKWVIKPPAAHFSNNVFFISKEDNNAKGILQNMVNHYEAEKKYCVLQKAILSTSEKEIRVLFANGKVVGQYKKKNRLVVDSKTELYSLSSKEYSYCKLIGNHLKKIGAYYVGVDMIYPYLIEFNTLNPGGIATILKISGEDISSKVVSCIFGKNLN